jgi:CubicO group peptidase (beta-lactamase class C family)
VQLCKVSSGQYGQITSLWIEQNGDVVYVDYFNREISDYDGGFGQTFTYCTAGVQLLGEIVERATGESTAEFAARQLFNVVVVITKSDFRDPDAHEKYDRFFRDEIAVRLQR